MRCYGLIGFPLTHSFSPAFFTEKFKQEGLNDCSYETYPMEEIGSLKNLLEIQPFLGGLNVTIPHKKAVLAMLDSFDEVVEKTGSCNCIKIENGKLIGYNTDVIGFEKSLVPLLSPHHCKALVLGTGGSAAAVRFVLDKLGIDYLSASRNENQVDYIAYNAITPQVMASHTLIINTTPLGMFPHIHDCPAIPYDSITNQHILFDLIYNPAETLFLQKGKERGATIKNGAEMLMVQAEESWKIWSNVKI